MPRFSSWIAVGLAGAFLIVASVNYGASTVATLAFAVSIATLVISAGIAVAYRRHLATAVTAVLTAAVSAWTLVASLIFSSETAQNLAFAGSLAIGALALVGLTVHELSVERVVHALDGTSGKSESHLSAAA